MFQLLPGLTSALMAGLSFVAVSLEPAPDRGVAQWAEDCRVVSRKESNKPGPWLHSRFPVAVEIMDACSLSDPSEQIPIRGSAQSIKSEIAKNGVGHFTQDLERSSLIVLPTHEEALKYERTKLDPMLRACKSLSRRIHGIGNTSGPKSSTAKHKEFANGSITITSAGSSSGLQMISVGLIVLEEIAEFPADTDGRGHALDQARERGEAYQGELKIIIPSTPGMAGRTETGVPLCKITELFEAGDQRWIFWKCPHCGDHFRFQFSHMAEVDGDRPGTGRVVIFPPCCGAQIEHSAKRDMNKTAQYGGHCTFIPCFEYVDEDNPEKSNLVPWKKAANGDPIVDVIAAEDFERAKHRDTQGRDKSFHIWRGQSPFSNWASIWKTWLKAQNDPIKLKTFYQQYLGEPYEQALNVPKHEDIFAMRGGAPDPKTRPIIRGRIPPWAGFVTKAVDVQGDRLEWRANAYGPGGKCAAIDHGIIDGEPYDPRVWTQLREVLGREYPSDHMRPQRAARIGIDTGGHYTDEVYKFIIANPHATGLKGMTGPTARFEPLTQSSRKGGKLKGVDGRIVRRVPLTLLNTHELKKQVYYGLDNALESRKSNEIQPGLNLFYHADIDTGFAKQLVSERLIKDEFGKKEYWDNIAGQANEQLDLEVYCYALALMYGLTRMTERDWLKLFTDEAIDPAEVNLTPLELIARQNPPASLPTRPHRPDTRPNWMRKMIDYNQS